MVNIGMKFIHLQVNEDIVYPVSENQATSGEAETNYRMEDESMSEESDNTNTAGENISMIDEPNSPIASIESDLKDMPDPVVEDSDPSPEHCSITSKIQCYDSTLYEKFEAITPLYEGSSVSVLQAVTHHMLWFTEHPGTSKDALSGILHMQHTKVLPQPNLLPDSYCAALKGIFNAKNFFFKYHQNHYNMMHKLGSKQFWSQLNASTDIAPPFSPSTAIKHSLPVVGGAS